MKTSLFGITMICAALAIPFVFGICAVHKAQTELNQTRAAVAENSAAKVGWNGHISLTNLPKPTHWTLSHNGREIYTTNGMQQWWYSDGTTNRRASGEMEIMASIFVSMQDSHNKEMADLRQQFLETIKLLEKWLKASDDTSHDPFFRYKITQSQLNSVP